MHPNTTLMTRQVMDCRICGDPNSAMRFAFIEFAEESSAQLVRHGGAPTPC